MTDLGPLSQFYPHGIDDAGQIAGTCNQSFPCVDSNGTFTTLPDPPGLTCTGAAAINTHGQVLGTCADGSQASTSNTRAVVWTNGTPTVLPTLGGPTTTAGPARLPRGFRGPPNVAPAASKRLSSCIRGCVLGQC